MQASAALLGQVQVCVDSGDTLSAVGLLAGTRCKKRFLDMFSCWHFSGWCLLTSSNKKNRLDPESIRGVDQTGLAFASAGHECRCAGGQVADN